MRRQFVGLIMIGSLAVAACGEEAARSASGDAKRYCDVTKSIFRGQEEPPTDAEMDEWGAAAAPTEAASDVKIAAAAYRDLNNSAHPDFGRLEQEPTVSSFNRVEDFNEQKCGIKVG